MSPWPFSPIGAALLGALSLSTAACGGDDTSEAAPSEPTVCDELRTLLHDGVEEQGAPGGTLAVTVPDEGPCLQATGMADRAAGRAMVPTDPLGIGSITKTFTSAVVLELRDEGVLSLADALEAWYPSFPRGDQITLEHLLRHMTGIYDIAYDGQVVSQPDADWDPEELVAIAAAEPPLFEPGAGYDYSNTNFILLGLVIEAATGRSWESQVRDRLIDPLGLEDTFIPTTEIPPEGAGGVAHGYFVNDDWTEYLSPSVGYGAGAILSSAPDLVRWLDALLHGEVLSEASKLEMQTPTELPNGELISYGLGLDLRSWGDGYGNAQGHTGDAIIYRAEAFHLPERALTVVVMLNGFPYEPGPIADAAWELLVAEAPH